MSKPPLDIKNPTLAAAILRRLGAQERANQLLARRAAELERQVVGLQQEVAKLRRQELSRAPDLEYRGEPVQLVPIGFAIVDRQGRSSGPARAVDDQSGPQFQQAPRRLSGAPLRLARWLRGLCGVLPDNQLPPEEHALVPDDCQ